MLPPKLETCCIIKVLLCTSELVHVDALDITHSGLSLLALILKFLFDLIDQYLHLNMTRKGKQYNKCIIILIQEYSNSTQYDNQKPTSASVKVV